MQQQSRHQHLRQNFDPMNLVVKSVQLPTVVKGEENEGHKTENVEMYGARRIPAARKDEKTDEKIDQAEDPRIILNGGWFLGRSGDERSLKLLAIARQFVADLRPQPRPPKALGYLHLPGDGAAVDSQEVIPRANAGAGGGRVFSHLLGL